MNRRWLAALLRSGAGALILAAIVVTVFATWDDGMARYVDHVPLLGLVAGLSVASTWLTASAWLTLIEGQPRRWALRRAFFASHLAKYLPVGGLLQAAGQIALTTRVGVGARRVLVAFATQMLLTVAASFVVAAPLLALGGAPSWAVAASVAGLVSLAVLHRPVLAVVLDWLHRRWERFPTGDHVPSSVSLLRGWLLLVAAMLARGIGYALLLEVAATDAVNVLMACGAFALAWVVGFLAVPVPGGVGIREAVLVATLGTGIATPLVAASAVDRLLGIGGELLLYGVAVLAGRRERPTASAVGQASD